MFYYTLEAEIDNELLESEEIAIAVVVGLMNETDVTRVARICQRKMLRSDC